MAEEPVVANMLSPQMIKPGEALLRRLDQFHFPVKAALWISVPESGLWRLLIAFPEVRLGGRRRAYRQLLSHVNKIGSPALSLSNISVVDTHDPLVELLRRRGIKTEGPGISGIQILGNTINGVSFPDAYIYRVVSK